MRYRRLEDVKKLGHPVIDCHMHVRHLGEDGLGSLDEAYCDALIDANDRLGIDVSCVAPIRLTGEQRYGDFHAGNDQVLAAMQRHPGRILGWCFVNPGDPKALEEMEQRILGEGFIGVKLYNQYRIDEPVVEPIIEQSIAWQAPILMHAGHPTDPATRARQPRISEAIHFVNAAARYPEAMLIEGHIGGGGDWEWSLKHLREAPSVYVDISGSVVDEGIVDRTVAALGIDRLLFATDMTFEGSMGKALDADLTDDAFSKLMGRNFQAILDRRAI